MRGVAVPPLIIEKAGKQSRGPQTRSTCKPVHLYNEYPWVTWEISEAGFINIPIFIEWAEMLRQYLGHTRPVLLLSDGHSTRTNKKVVDTLTAINIHLFLIPSNTSHALAASDQFHQHIHRRRFVLERKLRIEENRGLHRDDKMECLLQAVTDCIDMCGLMRAAFHHAGISRKERSVALLRNKPSPDSPLPAEAAAPAPAPAESEHEANDESPSTSQESNLSPRTKTRILRRYKRDKKALQKAVSALVAAAAVAEARPRDMREQRAKRRAQRASLHLRGLMTHDNAYAQLKKRSEAVAARKRAKAKASRGRSLGKQVREALGKETGEEERRPRKDELVAYLTMVRVTFSPRAKYSALEERVRAHLEGSADATSAGDDDEGEAGEAFSASEEEEEWPSDDDDTVILTGAALIGITPSDPTSSTSAAASTSLLSAGESTAASVENAALAGHMCEGTQNDQENEPIISTLPDDELMRALFSSCPTSMIDIRVYCQKIAAAEDEKEEHERKRSRRQRKSGPSRTPSLAPAFPLFPHVSAKKGALSVTRTLNVTLTAFERNTCRNGKERLEVTKKMTTFSPSSTLRSLLRRNFVMHAPHLS